MAKERPLPNREEMEKLIKAYESKPNYWDEKLERSTEARIRYAEANFYSNFIKLRLNEPYIIRDSYSHGHDLEAHFDLRVKEGLVDFLEKYLNEYAEWAKSDNIIIIKSWKTVKEPDALPQILNPKKDVSEDSRPVSAIDRKILENSASLRRFSYAEKANYRFLIENNPIGVSLRPAEIKLPSHFGPGRKDHFFGLLRAAGLLKYDKENGYIIV